MQNVPSTSAGRTDSKQLLITISSSEDSQTDSTPWVSAGEDTKSKPVHKCPHCHEVYASERHVVRHIKTMCIVNPESEANKVAHRYRCLSCSRTFKELKSLRYHERNECQQSATCPDCGQTFKGSYVPQRHSKKYCKKVRSKVISRKQNIKQEVSSEELFIDDSSAESD